ncbi:MAG: putative metalloprotease CJM1_0395 family protein [Alphaproteobacteria bacterium]
MIDAAIATSTGIASSTGTDAMARLGALRAAALRPGADAPPAPAEGGGASRAAPFSNRPVADGATLLAAQNAAQGAFGRAGPTDSQIASGRDDAQTEDAQTDDAPGELTPEEKDQVSKLKDRDAEVRRHEEAHARVGGPYAGSPSYTFQTGPDGRKYAIGGQVPIDVSPVEGDPKATIAKMEVVKRAALAPAEPSSQDRRVAAEADRAKLEAQAALMEQTSAEQASAGQGPKTTNPLERVTSADAPGGTLDLVA